MRPIDADALRKSIETDRDKSDMPEMWYQGIEYAINHIIHAPAIEPEREKGKWIGGEIGYCSCCGHKGCASDIWNGCDDGEFCPNCGADMRGDQDE